MAAPLAMAQTPPPGAATATPAQPCRDARAIHDTSCPNYTGYSHRLDGSAALPGASSPDYADDAAGLGPVDYSIAQPQLRKGPEIERGLASWYGERHHGARTASGESFSKHAFTAAHKTLPFGTRVLVRNVRTGKEAVVRITDRGPHTRNRVIDVSKAAAEALGMVARGHDTVVLHALAPGKSGAAPSADVRTGLVQGNGQ